MDRYQDEGNTSWYKLFHYFSFKIPHIGLYGKGLLASGLDDNSMEWGFSNGIHCQYFVAMAANIILMVIF